MNAGEDRKKTGVKHYDAARSRRRECDRIGATHRGLNWKSERACQRVLREARHVVAERVRSQHERNRHGDRPHRDADALPDRAR
ncbi:hypothetical protein [Burkholderia sp. IMCC1007]|uniref:hypothetical protein n=1 Tax=Burkholderia sp. IMCC1007 TaxID=3004104 RepID=UPI0022B38F9B|nr:hypothetical protein [Burkholderia sp. IMCC1007]